MAQERIEIHFKPKGDQALIRAIKELDVATKRLKGEVSRYEKELKQATLAQKKHSKALILGTRNMRNMGKGATRLGVALSKLRSKLLIISFAVALVSKGIALLTGRFAEQEKAEKMLSTAYGKNITNLKNYASGLQQVTTFGDEVILGAQALLAAFIKDEDQLKQATKATLELAAAKGLDLNTAADLVGKSFGSSTNALSRYGIQAEGAVGSSKRLNSITQDIANLYSGQATAATDTLSGSIEQMKNAFGDANEAVGKAFAPTIQKLAGWFKETSEAAREFFLTTTEDPLETSIRHLEEMGENVDDLRLVFEKANLSSLVKGTKDSKELQKDLTNAVKDEVAAKRLVADEQVKLVNSGRSLLQLQDDSTTSWSEALDILLNISNGELVRHNISKMQAQSILKGVDAANLSLAAEESNVAAIKQKLKDQLIYEAALIRIRDLEAALGITMADTVVEAHAKLHTKVIKFFDETMVEIAGKQQNLFHMVDEVAEKSTEVLNEWGNQATESANRRVDAIDSVMNKDIENLKKSRKFQKMSASQQEKEEQKIRDKAEKDKDKAKKKANQIKAAEFRIDQAMRLKQAIMNTAEEVAKHAGNPFMAAFTYAAGAAQIALIASQKPPKMAKGGFVGGNLHSQGGTMIEAERGEFVMSRDAVNTIGAENLNRMNRGGGGAMNISFSGNVMSDDFLESEAIPKIKEAIRRGADIGIG